MPVVTLPPMGRPAREALLSQTEQAMSFTAEMIGTLGQTSKADLVRAMQLPRSTLSTQVDWLFHRGILRRANPTAQMSRGRPADAFALNGDAGAVLAVEMGAIRTTGAVIDLAGRILARKRVALPVANGPEKGMDQIVQLLESLLAEVKAKGFPVAQGHGRVVSIAFPARLEVSTCTPMRPTIMPTWDGFPVRASLEKRLGCQVVLENDCNVRAFGEAALLGKESLPLISVQVGTGIGAGIIGSDGRIIHGANGSAGDIGHVPSAAANTKTCICGARGCVETVASVPAMLEQIGSVRELEEQSGLQGSDLLAELLLRRDQRAIGVVREGSEAVGAVIASLCNIINPKRIVITSGLAAVSHDQLAAIRSVVYSSARPLATKDLVIDHSHLGDTIGIAGAFLLGRERLLAPDNISRIRVPRTR